LVLRSGNGIDTLLTWHHGGPELMDSITMAMGLVGSAPTMCPVMDKAAKRARSRKEPDNVTLR
jgi:hypothetical protein